MASVRLIKIIKLAAKNVMIKLNGSFRAVYAPIIKLMPKPKKKKATMVMAI